MLDRKAKNHTKNNDIYSSWVHALFKTELITYVRGAVQFVFFFCLSFFLFIPSARSLSATSKHWHTCQLEKCHPIPFLAGPMAEQMACGCQAPTYLLPCAFMMAKKQYLNPSILLVEDWKCVLSLCVFMKISPSCQIWGTTLGTLATAFIYRSSPVTSTSWTAKAKRHSWVSLKMRPHILYSPLGGCWSKWGNYLDSVQSTSN